jgi:anti-sigma B factor antagonist
MTAELPVVFVDRVEAMTTVQTTAADDWRAAVTLQGELDIANAHEIREEFNRHLEAGRRVIRVDTAGVEFIDSTALGEIILASNRCRREHGSLILTNVPARMRRLLTLAGLDQLLLVDTAGSGPQQATSATE